MKVSEAENNKDTIAPNVCKFSLPMMMSALHEKAIEQVGDKGKISNSAIEGEGKNAKLTSAGEHIICVTSSKEGENIYKTDAFAALTTYIKWFAGPDLAKNVSMANLLELVNDDEQQEDSQDKKYEDGEDLDDEPENDKENISKSESSDELGADEEGPDEEGSKDKADVKKESKANTEHHQLKTLFLADGSIMSFMDFLNESSLHEDSNDDKKEKTSDDEDDLEEGKNDESSQGYYIAYNLKVNGLKESKLKDSMKDLAKGLFDTLTITASGLFGGGSSFTGKDIRRKFNELANIDTQKLAEDVETLLKKKYPTTEINAYERDGNTLYKELNQYASQLDKDQKAAIQNAPYSVCIKVKEKDRAKPFVNAKKIAEAIRKCISFFKLGSKLKVDGDSVIVIEDYVDKNARDEAAANKRPSFQALDTAIRKAYEDRKGLQGKPTETPLSISNARQLIEQILKRFTKITTDKKALDQEENKKAVAVFEKHNEKWKKILNDGENFKFDIFKEFLDEYEKLEKELKKESMILLDRRGIAKMLFEELFPSKSNHFSFDEILAEDDPKEDQADDKKSNSSDKNKTADSSVKIDFKTIKSRLSDEIIALTRSVLTGKQKETWNTSEICYVKKSEEIVKDLSDAGLGSDAEYQQITSSGKYAMAIILKKPQSIGKKGKKKGSMGLLKDENLFNDSSVGTIFKNAARSDLQLEKLIKIEGKAKSKIVYNETHILADCLVFVEACNPSKTDNGSGSSKGSDAGDSTGIGEISGNEGDASSSDQAEGTTLYIYPMKNSNKLDDGMKSD